MINLRLLITSAVLFGLGHTGLLATDQNTLNRIDHYLTEGVTQGFSGAVLIAKQGEIVFSQGYGYANKNKKLAYAPDTIATIGSVTKQFTGAAIVKLLTDRKLNVTDTLSKFFDSVPTDKKDITVHQLLTHSAGFVDVIGQGDFDPMPRDVFFKNLLATDLGFKPGSRHVYSNAGYSILGRIVELVAGMSYEQYLNKHLFQPAGMLETGYLMPKWDLGRVANGYLFNVKDMGTLIDRFNQSKKKNPTNPDRHISWVLKANGGIHSTLNDMYKWYLALKNTTVLSEKEIELLTTPYIAETEDGSSHYGYGWAIFNSDRNTKIVSHNGGNGIFFFDFLWLPEEDVAIIFSTNAHSRQAEVAWRLERMLFNPKYQPKPIQSSPFEVVFRFISENEPDQFPQLKKLVQEEHGGVFKHPSILNRMGYMALGEEQMKPWAVGLFQINKDLFPKEPNVWDSLGEALLETGRKDEAIKYFKKAAEMGHDYAKKRLKKLGDNP